MSVELMFADVNPLECIPDGTRRVWLAARSHWLWYATVGIRVGDRRCASMSRQQLEEKACIPADVAECELAMNRALGNILRVPDDLAAKNGGTLPGQKGTGFHPAAYYWVRPPGEPLPDLCERSAALEPLRGHLTMTDADKLGEIEDLDAFRSKVGELRADYTERKSRPTAEVGT